MGARKNARSPMARRAGKVETAALAGMTFSENDFTMTAASRQAGRIWELLPEGEMSAVPADDLATLAGYRNIRSLRLAVDRLRARGVPILASESGYYKPDPGPAGIAEIRRFLRRQDARAASNRKTTRLIRARLKSLENAPLDGQEALF